MPEPESSLRINITGNMMIDGIAIHIGYQLDHENARILHFNEHGHQTWDFVRVIEQVSPTMVLADDVARGLLDALTRHYQGASDMSTVRSDLLHERGRVDKMIGTLSEITVHIISQVGER